MATDSNFANIVSSGATGALPANGFTAKVDATGWSAGAAYFYRFRDAAGTTSSGCAARTLPVFVNTVKSKTCTASIGKPITVTTAGTVTHAWALNKASR